MGCILTRFLCYLDPATRYILSLHLQLDFAPSSSLFIYIYLDKHSEPQVNILGCGGFEKSRVKKKVPLKKAGLGGWGDGGCLRSMHKTVYNFIIEHGNTLKLEIQVVGRQ